MQTTSLVATPCSERAGFWLASPPDHLSKFSRLLYTSRAQSKQRACVAKDGMSTCVVGMCGTRPLSCRSQPRGTIRLSFTRQPSLAHSVSVVSAGVCHRQSCSTFRPRPSAYRLCRKARSQLLSCTASSGAQSMQPVQPTVLQKAAASIVSFWQHSLKQLASFVRVQREPTQTDSTVCEHQRCAHFCKLDRCSTWGVPCRKSMLTSGPPSKT